MPLPTQYDHKERERFWQKRWFEGDVYHYRSDQSRDQTFVIDTPPPTVSGVLHMGHIFSYTQADFVARYQRMIGKDVFYPIGFDDNGLPTERLVEKTKNVRGSAMPRADFVALCREVVKEAEGEFRDLFKSAALSVDWRQEYQTISDEVCALSQASFLELLHKGEAYRDFRPTYWDWVDQTAIAQAEIENKELPGVMNEIEFELCEASRPSEPSATPHVSGSSRDSGGDKIIIMTTRPELLGACVAVMYHPEDVNAAKYVGKHAITPLFGVRVPMIADEAVEREKGTGLVMCCTFGDDTDKEWWRKYKLPTIHLLQKDGRLDFTNHDSPSTIRDSLQGLKPKQANAKIIELLQAAGKLIKQTPMVHTVKCAERSGTPIEIIPTHQWFIRLIDKKEALLAKGAQCEWHPEYMRIRLNQWIDGLKEDWCISRQRFFGVPFPVWFSKRAGEEGKLLVADFSQLPVDPLTDTPPGYTRDEVTPSTDVMDTWATSSISPQINAKSLQPNALFPADLRPQAHEIIRTWAFYTIAKAHLHSNTIAWKHLMISGWCLASDKTKMSKSKGNVVTPVALIEEKGSDAVRYWASTSRLGADTAFSEDLLKIGKKLVTKLWNASQFVAAFLEDAVAAATITEPLDRWILARLAATIHTATAAFERFEYADARVATEEFFWKDFCDNYLELVKARAYGDGVSIAARDSARATLRHCLDAILRLFAPFIPHVTEEIFTHLLAANTAQSIHQRGMWPKITWQVDDSKALQQAGGAVLQLLEAVRKTKSERNLSIKAPLGNIAIEAVGESSPEMLALLTGFLADLQAAANASGVVMQSRMEEPTAITADGAFKLWIPIVYQEIRQPAGEPKLENPLKNMQVHGHVTTPVQELAHSAKIQVEPAFEAGKERKR